jgi:hypothetical protein
MGDHHPTIDLALMAKRLERTVKTVKKIAEKLPYTVKIC